jgi:hypothetical protein
MMASRFQEPVDLKLWRSPATGRRVLPGRAGREWLVRNGLSARACQSRGSEGQPRQRQWNRRQGCGSPPADGCAWTGARGCVGASAAGSGRKARRVQGRVPEVPGRVFRPRAGQFWPKYRGTVFRAQTSGIVKFILLADVRPGLRWVRREAGMTCSDCQGAVSSAVGIVQGLQRRCF